MTRQLLLALGTLAAGAMFGLISPAQAHDAPRGGHYERADYRRTPPPPPRHEAPPTARRGSVWIPGYWRAAGPRYVWQAGHWERARPGHRYVPERWVRTPHGWQLRRGYWSR